MAKRPHTEWPGTRNSVHSPGSGTRTGEKKLQCAAQEGNANVAQAQMPRRVQQMICNVAEKVVKGIQAVDSSEYNSPLNKG
jgi:hypothetical protein